MLVQQPNGQQMWVQQAQMHGGWGQQQWGETSGGDGGGGGGGYAGASPGASPGVPGFDAVDAIKGQPLPLGLNLKRSNSLQNMVESSGLLDAKFDAPMDANNMFRDVELMEEDALDAILTQSRDGNLLSFDGMDEAMLEAAAGGETDPRGWFEGEGAEKDTRDEGRRREGEPDRETRVEPDRETRLNRTERRGEPNRSSLVPVRPLPLSASVELLATETKPARSRRRFLTRAPRRDDGGCRDRIGLSRADDVRADVRLFATTRL